MRYWLIFCFVFISFDAFAAYQVRYEKKQMFFAKKMDEEQLLNDLRDCFTNPYVSQGNPVTYKTGTCIFSDQGQRFLLISVLGKVDHVIKRFENEVNNDLWLYSLKVMRRHVKSIPLPL